MGRSVTKGRVTATLEHRRPAVNGQSRTLVNLKMDCAIRSEGIAISESDARALLAALVELLAPVETSDEAAGLAPRCGATMGADAVAPPCELAPGHPGYHRGGGVGWGAL